MKLESSVLCSYVPYIICLPCASENIMCNGIVFLQSTACRSELIEIPSPPTVTPVSSGGSPNEVVSTVRHRLVKSKNYNMHVFSLHKLMFSRFTISYTSMHFTSTAKTKWENFNLFRT